MTFNPCKSSRNIVEFYKRYILTTFRMKDEDYNKQLEDVLNKEGELFKGPYLSVSAPYKKGHSLVELAKNGEVNENIIKLKRLYPNRPLYCHQEDALRKIKAGKSIIVSTGTGSGKTESFLIPVINELLEEEKMGKLTSGVRALIIYPMNALVNDQIDRMEKMLAGTKITFGYYTGETKEDEDDAIGKYRDTHNNQDAPSNELLSRKEMRENPPHILITNYAMLEYLLLRPNDNNIFRQNSKTWRYIIFDEAHSYNGAKAIEVACLVKRVKAMLNRDDIQFILTSATLGDPNKSPNEIINFANNLCGTEGKVKFDENSIIRAQTIEFEKPKELFKNIPTAFYTTLAKDDNDTDKLQKLKSIMPNIENNTLSEMLFDFISKDEFYYNFREFLKEGPKTIREITKKLNISEDNLIDFISIASQASKNDTRLFEAKYHMFIKGIDGVFITLNPSKKLFVKKIKTYKENPEDPTDIGEKVFQVSFCSNCNALYIIGKNIGNHLEQPSDYEETPDIFLLNGLLEEEIERNTKRTKYTICAKCGEIHKDGDSFDCKCGDKYKNSITKIEYGKGSIHVCPCCNYKNTHRSIIRPYLLGNDAATAVISSGLYNELPGEIVEIKRETINAPIFGISEVREEQITKPLQKQFLTFSDSRQAAAFFAPYLQETYEDNLVKRIITKIVEERKENFKQGITLQQLADLLFIKFTEKQLFTKGPLKEAWVYILSELSNFKAKNSLEKKGILKFELDSNAIQLNQDIITIDNIRNGNQTFSKQFTKEEIKTLCNILIRTMIKESAFDIETINNQNSIITFNDDDIERISITGQKKWRKYQNKYQNNKEYSYWSPEDGHINPRLRFLCKVLGEDISDCPKSRDLLDNIWNILSSKNYQIITNGALNLSKIRVKSADKLYICPKCKNIFPFNLKGVCNYSECKGTEPLQEYNYEEMLNNDHYRNMYHTYDISPMEVKEHTAQLSSEKATQYQDDFKNKKINVLSCSTTFELGVDVGSLQTVFMRDMPPTPANYAQRAGRAGRSAKAAAYAITFCQNSSHDLNYFGNPLPMILGKIEPPAFDISNDKIILRHIFASAFSFFWQNYPDKYYQKISDFFDNDGFNVMKQYLWEKPEDLKDYLLKTVPQDIQDIWNISDFKWVKKLFNDSENIEELGYFDVARRQYYEDIAILEDEKLRLCNEDRGTNYIQNRINTIKDQDIIGFLSRNNLIPKYGFPVDTINLYTEYNNFLSDYKEDLRLSRDLFYAISEYAPESEVVADGYLYKSKYIKKMNDYGWPTYKYAICDYCKTLIRTIDTDSEKLEQCPQCGRDLGPNKKYIIPKFGFQIERGRPKKVGLNKPEKTYRGEIHYVGNGKSADFKENYTICEQKINIEGSQRDTLVVLNESPFYVCKTCGYATIQTGKGPFITEQHKHPNGNKDCNNNKLDRFSLGHEILTDVTVLKFPNIDTSNPDKARTILYSLIEGFSRSMNIDRRELSGCLQMDKDSNFKFIIFDNTPGGAGYVKQLRKPNVLKNTLREGFRVVETCSCGEDTTCYNCLCNYYNQKYHDILKRQYAIDFYKNFAKTYDELK